MLINKKIEHTIVMHILILYNNNKYIEHTNELLVANSNKNSLQFPLHNLIKQWIINHQNSKAKFDLTIF